MSVYPPEIKQVAARLIQDEGFINMYKHRLNELKDDIALSTEKEQILDAHAEYTHIRAFAEWIEMLAEEPLRHE
jgi:hypothetical protein